MSSHLQPKCLTFKSGGSIAKGTAVKIGADNLHVVVCSAKTDRSIGIAQNDVTGAEQLVEVALPGGGSKAKAGGSVSAGDLVAPTTDGSLITTTGPGDRYIAMALEDAASGDLFATNIVPGLI